jgi:hypothetical protein
MAAIDAAQLAGRNAIIDWLRPQGFSFSNASWIERIHHNGGRPIYLDKAPPRRVERRRPKGDDAPGPPTPPPVPPPAPAARAEPGDPYGVEDLLAAGKAYRPLAAMLIEQVRQTLPGVRVSPRAGLISFARPNELAVLSVTARELRLGLDLGDRPFAAPLAKAKLAGASAAISHMLVLTDARQVDGGLIKLVCEADARANPPPPEPDRHH